jgi:hypothetical protein
MMKHLKGHACHECAPKDWRQTPDLTGSHELDAAIARTKNKDVPDRLKMFMENEVAYGARTGYDGYHNYSGDN